MVVTKRDQAELFEQLVTIAYGDVDLVRDAIRIASGNAQAANLEPVLNYIITNRAAVA